MALWAAPLLNKPRGPLTVAVRSKAAQKKSLLGVVELLAILRRNYDTFMCRGLTRAAG